MRADDRWDDLPEAIPLHRVAPWWRLLAILALIGMVGLLVVVLILGIAVVQLQDRPLPTFAPTPAPVAVVPPGVAPTADEPPAEGENLPYPVKADLAEADPYERVEPTGPRPAKPHPTRERFLDIEKAVDLWKLKSPLPNEVSISPDGQNLAYIIDGHLTAGPIGGQRRITATVTTPVPLPGPRGRAVYTSPMVVSASEVKLVRAPSWAADNRFVYCADANGHLRRYDLGNSPSGQAESSLVPFHGDWPATLPTEPEKLIFVRGQPRPKVDAPGASPALDLTEVVLGDLSTKEIRVLVPASRSSWQYLAVSPDGTRLALVSDRGHEGQGVRHLRVFVLELAGGEPKPLTPPATHVGPLCWTADSQALVYARSQDLAPADYWEAEPAGPNGILDLYHWDLTTNHETRLSRGGGCFSPSLSGNEDLYYLAVQEIGSELLLRRVPLAAAREFADREPQAPGRDAAAWADLFDRVLEETKTLATVDGTALTTEVRARLVETFRRLYRERFHSDPPSTLKAFDRQRRELQQLTFAPPVYPVLTLVLGVFEGEYLAERHGARWHLAKGPLLPSRKDDGEPAQESPFGVVANPFAVVVNATMRQTARSQRPKQSANPTYESLVALLHRAEGRTLVLTNDPLAARAALAELADPDFQRGVGLLAQGKGDEAEQVFEKLGTQKRHEHNLHLALQIGNRLYEHKRLSALQRWMEQHCEQPPPDARKFNLLGLALLESQPRQARDAFKNALRCDVRFEPAYLNLAQAYQLANDPNAARLCLQRYLALLPDGVYAADARRRLAAVDPEGN